MASRTFVIDEIERISSKGERERLSFENGLNLLVGRPNTGKTMWLRMLDYVLGDRDAAERTLSEELAEKYDSVRVRAHVGDEELVLERRWKESGAKNKIFVDNTAISSENFSSVLLEKLGIPVLHYPQGDPYASRTWTELSLRSLYRHIYRQQLYCWGSLVERQPEGEQHACLLQFLGLGEHVYSEEYGALIQARRARIELEAQRDNFMRTQNEVSRGLLDVEDEVVGITPEAISDGIGRVDSELEDLRRRHESTLEALLADSVERMPSRVHELAEERARLLTEHTKAAAELRAAETRLSDISEYRKDIEGELGRLERARVSGRVFTGLRISNCPACDQRIGGSNDEGTNCFLCRRPLPEVQGEAEAGAKRLEVAIRQLRSERDEAEQLVEELARRHRELTREVRRASERIAELEADLDRVRQPAAAFLPPELSQLDVQAGRLEERKKHWERVRELLRRREEFASKISEIQARISELDDAVERRARQLNFESASDLLVDGLNDYLRRLNYARPGSWTQEAIDLRLGEKNFRFTVGGERWESRLGGTLTLYFLLAYQYGLLRLTREERCHYPGLAVLDMPAELPDVESVSDLEDFVLEPFVRLLGEKGMEGAQMIVAGSSFEGLEGAHRIELEHVF